MILEVAMLDVHPGKETPFERDFALASQYISSVPGYVAHELNRCLEKPGRYVVLVRWTTLEAHTVGFRKSPAYLEWKKLLHDYYVPVLPVAHYTNVSAPKA